jgi:hypothetical protein
VPAPDDCLATDGGVVRKARRPLPRGWERAGKALLVAASLTSARQARSNRPAGFVAAERQAWG